MAPALDPALWGFTPFNDDSPGFVGRETELLALRKGYESGKRLGLISGTVGVGKTSLAHVFAKNATDLFPGGMSYVYAFPGEDLRVRIPKPRSRRTLLVIDEAHSLEPVTVSMLEEALQKYPHLNLLIVGQKLPEFRFTGQFSVFLHEFAEAEVLTLLRNRLEAVDQDAARNLYRLLGGNPVALGRAAFALHEGQVTWDELLQGIQDFHYAGIIGPDGRPLRKESKERSRIILDVARTNEEIFYMLRKNPKRWYSLSPRKFEEIVAELLSKLGYEVTLTPVSGDGGFDIYAAKRDGLGEFLFLVECKRYTPPNKVGVEIVRALQGILSDHRATGAAIVTTSFFTSGAKEFQRRFQHQLKLHDYLVLQKWLKILD